ncbi:hypothetical protein ACFL9T_04900 [Thermodesulfobacteriota bacterium]
MSDRTFQWSLTGLTVLVIAWIVVGITLHLLPMGVVVIIAIMVELFLGGYLLHRWSKHFTERTEDVRSGSGQPRGKAADSDVVKTVPREQGVREKIVPNWQVTTTTVNCDRVGHEVTLNIYKEWTTACQYHRRWGPVRREKKAVIVRALAWIGTGSDEKQLPSSCTGIEECPHISEYRDKLYDMEAAKRT